MYIFHHGMEGKKISPLHHLCPVIAPLMLRKEARDLGSNSLSALWLVLRVLPDSLLFPVQSINLRKEKHMLLQ